MKTVVCTLHFDDDVKTINLFHQKLEFANVCKSVLILILHSLENTMPSQMNVASNCERSEVNARLRASFEISTDFQQHVNSLISVCGHLVYRKTMFIFTHTIDART